MSAAPDSEQTRTPSGDDGTDADEPDGHMPVQDRDAGGRGKGPMSPKQGDRGPERGKGPTTPNT